MRGEKGGKRESKGEGESEGGERVREERENERAEGERWRGREIEIVSERDREIASEIEGER